MRDIRHADRWQAVNRFAVILVAFAAIGMGQALEIPAWVERGILAVESRSAIDADGLINYVDRRTGEAGERGPYQMTAPHST